MSQNFMHHVVHREFPTIKLQLIEHSRWARWWKRLVGGTVQVAILGKHTLYIPEVLMQSRPDSPLLTEVLAHEYVHMWQRANNRWFTLHRTWPYLLALVVVVGVALWSMSVWFTLFALLPLIPVYNPVVIREEYEAYCASILARVCVMNNEHPLPKNADALFGLSDDGLRSIVNTMFSSTYLMQWAPRAVREKYFQNLRVWHAGCKFNYFHARFAFEKNNGYIHPSFPVDFGVDATPGFPYLRRPFTHILRYLVQFSKR
jgi:hypothetical protein